MREAFPHQHIQQFSFLLPVVEEEKIDPSMLWAALVRIRTHQNGCGWGKSGEQVNQNVSFGFKHESTRFVCAARCMCRTSDVTEIDSVKAEQLASR